MKKKNHPLIIAHRGACTECPENTVAAYQRAIDMGVDCIETDLQLTLDGQLVCIHDACFDQPPSEDGESCTVCDLTAEEIQRRTEGPSQAPLLEELLQLDRGEIGLFLELKPECWRPKEMVQALFNRLELFAGWGSPEIYVGSFSRDILAELDPHIPKHRRIGLVHYEGDFLPQISLDPGIMALHYHLITEERLHDLQSRHIEVWAWTVNDVPHARELAQAGVSAIITDNPRLMLHAFKLGVSPWDPQNAFPAAPTPIPAFDPAIPSPSSLG